MSEDGQDQEIKQQPISTGRVVHQIGGGDIVIETFDDGSVRINGDTVTPAKQVTLDDVGDAAA